MCAHIPRPKRLYSIHQSNTMWMNLCACLLGLLLLFMKFLFIKLFFQVLSHWHLLITLKKKKKHSEAIKNICFFFYISGVITWNFFYRSNSNHRKNVYLFHWNRPTKLQVDAYNEKKKKTKFEFQSINSCVVLWTVEFCF